MRNIFLSNLIFRSFSKFNLDLNLVFLIELAPKPPKLKIVFDFHLIELIFFYNHYELENANEIILKSSVL